LDFKFKKVGENQKVIFQCLPIQVGDQNILGIKVSGYQVVDVDKETREQAEAAQKASEAAEKQASVQKASAAAEQQAVAQQDESQE
jgi:hypothetical protein